MLRDFEGIRQFAVRLLAVSHRESLDRFAPDSGGQRSHCAGVKSSAQKYAQRHIAHKMAGHALFQQLAVGLDVETARTVVSIGADREIPVWLDLQFPAFIQFQRVAWKQLLNPGK